MLAVAGICWGIVCACGKGEENGNPGGGETPVTPSLDPGLLKVATVNLLKPDGRRAEMSMDLVEVRTALKSSIVKTGASLIAFNELDQDFIQGGKYSLITICQGLSPSWRWSLEWPNDIHADNTVTYSYSNGFAYDSSVLELKESGFVWLSKEASEWYTEPSAAYLKSGSPERTCIWTRFVLKSTQTPFWFFVSHLPTESQGGGATMATNLGLFTKSKAGDAPQILCGDLNSAPGNNEFPYALLKTLWKDAYETIDTAGGLGPYASYQGTMSGSSGKYYYPVDTYTKNHPERRIDHIMTRGSCTAITYSTIVQNYMYGGKAWCPSDHLPVVATIDFNR